MALGQEGRLNMRMPQDFVDAINAAVREVNPDAHMANVRQAYEILGKAG